MTKATQEKILDSAEKLFWMQGHKGTSLDEIAKNAGQSKGAFFHYFRNKKDVTKLVLDKYAQDVLFAPLEQHFTQSQNLKDALYGWARQVYASYSENAYQGGCMLGNMALELSDRDEEMRAELARIFLEWENRLVGFLKARAYDGQLLMEPRQFARILIASLQGITMTIKVHKDKNRAAREFQAMGDMIERLVQN